MDLIKVAFPGLGIEEFTLDSVAIKNALGIDGMHIYWYGVCIMLGILFAFCYGLYRSRQEGFTHDDILDVGLYMVLFGVLGARLYYILMKPEIYFRADRTLWQNLGEMVNIRGGGLAIYGGIIAGILTIIVYCRIKKKDFRRILDLAAPGVMFAQAMGRWGNFFNGEAHGGIVAEGHPLYFLRMGLYPNDLHTPEMAYVHPTFLYESLWNILGFVLINAFVYRNKKFNGQVAYTYLAWYGFGRMFIEGLRTDSLYLGNTNIRVSQLVGFLCFVVFTGLIVYVLVGVRKKMKEGSYVPVFPVPADEQTESAEQVNSQNENKENEDTAKEEENDGTTD